MGMFDTMNQARVQGGQMPNSRGQGFAQQNPMPMRQMNKNVGMMGPRARPQSASIPQPQPQSPQAYGFGPGVRSGLAPVGTPPPVPMQQSLQQQQQPEQQQQAVVAPPIQQAPPIQAPMPIQEGIQNQGIGGSGFDKIMQRFGQPGGMRSMVMPRRQF